MRSRVTVISTGISTPDSLQGGSDERDVEDDPFRESEDEPDPQKFYYEDVIPTQ